MKRLALLLALLATNAFAAGPVLWGPSSTARNLQDNLKTERVILIETGGGTDTVTIQVPAAISPSYTLTLPTDDGTSGQVLSTDGSGVTSWLTLPVGASGATGSVQFATGGAFNSDNANFFWDDTNNRLGLGTATPAVTLDVNGTGLFDVLKLDDATGYPLLINGHTNTGLYRDASADKLDFLVNGGGLVIDASGNALFTGSLALNGTYRSEIGAGTYMIAINNGAGTYNQGLYWTGTEFLFANNNLGAPAFRIFGTNGAGYIDLVDQAFEPTAPAAGHVRLYEYGSSTLAVLDDSGHSAILDFAALTADRTYSFPNATGGVVLGDASQTLTNKVIDAASNTVTNVSLTTGITGTLAAGNGGTGITSLGTGIATWLGTPSSANLISALTDETGTGAAVFGTSPTFTTTTVWTATTDFGVLASTADASDDKSITIAGGGAASGSRGGFASIYGNEYTTKGGRVEISGGNKSTAAAANDAVTISGYAAADGGSSQVLASFTPTRGVKLRGTASNDDAAAGFVGEYLEDVQSTATNVGTTAQYFNLDSKLLTAGDWQCSGGVIYYRNGATFSATDLEIGLSGTDGNSATGLVDGLTVFYHVAEVPVTFTSTTLTLPPIRVQSDGTNLYINGATIASTQTVRLKGYVSAYTVATPQYRSSLRCWRTR